MFEKKWPSINFEVEYPLLHIDLIYHVIIRLGKTVFEWKQSSWVLILQDISSTKPSIPGVTTTPPYP